MAVLEELHWEGNVRQLRQTIERLAFLAEGETITVADLQRFGDDGKRRDGFSEAAGAMLGEWLAMPYKEARPLFERYYFEALFRECGSDLQQLIERSGYTYKGLNGLANRLGLPWLVQDEGSSKHVAGSAKQRPDQRK